MTTANQGWSFVTLVGEGDKGSKAPIGAQVTKPLQKVGYCGLKLWAWLLIGIAVIVVVTVAIVVPIVVSNANSDSDSDAPTSTLTLSHSPITCSNASQTADYTKVLRASGSSYHITSAVDTLYVKDPDGAGNGTCTTDFTTYDTNWPPVTANSSLVPALPDGVTATPTMWLGPDGYYYLRINGCIAYTYANNTASSPLEGISVYWPILMPDGSTKTANPVCS